MSTHLNTAAIIQARYASSRLPGKVLQEINGVPMLRWVVERTRQAGTISQVIVATTTSPLDDPLVGLCQQHGYSFVRGSEFDVLDRFHHAVHEYSADVVVRITADCPLIDPGLIDQTVAAYFGQYTVHHIEPRTFHLPAPWDFAANRLPPPYGRSYPIGLDVEVCSAAALERAWQQASEPHQREHVMPFLYDRAHILDTRQLVKVSWQIPPREYPFDQSIPEQFRVLLLHYTQDFGALRWTVDTPQDLELVRQLAARFNLHKRFSWMDVLEVVQAEPNLMQINIGVKHKNMTDIDERSV